MKIIKKIFKLIFIISISTAVYSSYKIITLSTCHNDKERLVLHAKLIKYKKKEA